MRKKRSVDIPSDDDLHHARIALVRLQNMYGLTASDMATGNIRGSKTGMVRLDGMYSL